MTDHSEKRSFIAAICAAPADDAPRLIYADWLEEHGDAGRAEDIRRAVRVGGWIEQTAHPLPPDSHDADMATNLVFNKGEPDEFFIHVPGYWEAVTLSRGFVSAIRLSAAWWLKNHAALAWHPDHCPHECPETAQPIRTVRLTMGFTPFDIGRIAVETGIDPDTADWPERSYSFLDDPAPLLKARWPWLTVELPAEPVMPSEQPLARLARLLDSHEGLDQERYESIARSLGVSEAGIREFAQFVR